MSDKKSDEQTKQVPNKRDYSERVEKRGDVHVPDKPGKPLYQSPTEPWPEKPKK